MTTKAPAYAGQHIKRTDHVIAGIDAPARRRRSLWPDFLSALLLLPLLAGLAAPAFAQTEPPASVTVTPTAVTIAEGGQANYSMELVAQPANDVQIMLGFTGTSVNTVSPATLTFTAANWDMVQTVTVTGVNDSTDNPGSGRIGTITHSFVAGTPTNSIIPGVRVTVTDDEPTTVSLIEGIRGDIVEGSGALILFDIRDRSKNPRLNLSRRLVRGEVLSMPLNFGGTATPMDDYTVALASPRAGHMFTPPDSGSRVGTATFTGPTGVTLHLHVTAVDDDIAEATETIIITRGTPSPGAGLQGGAIGGGPLEDRFNLLDPGVTISETAITIAENDEGTYTVVLGSPPAVTIEVTVASDTTSAVAVNAASTLLRFTSLSWSTPQIVTVTGVNDDINGNRMATISHSIDSGNGDGASYPEGLAIDTVEVTVTDDDLPVVSFAVGTSAANEGSGTHNIEVNLDPVPTSDTTITYTVTDLIATVDDDYMAPSGSVFVTANTSSVNIPVTIIDDSRLEDAELFRLTLTTTTGSGYTLGTPFTHEVIIVDNDLPLASFAVDTSMANEGSGTHNIEVNLSLPPAADTTITYTVETAVNVARATPDTDYTALTGMVVVPAGMTRADISVAITEDNTDERDEIIGLTLQALSGVYGTTSPATHELTLIDNDATTVTLAGAADDIAEDDTSAITITLGRGLRRGEVLPVPLTFAGTASLGTDYTLTGITQGGGVSYTIPSSGDAGTVTFTGASVVSSRTASLTLTAINGGTTVDIGLGTLDDTSGTGLSGGASGTDNLGAFNIISPGVTISERAITIAEGDEDTYTVVLATQPGAAVTITPTSGTLATATVSSALTFTSANWDTAQTITVAGVGNNADAANQAVTISHAATSTDSTYSAITPAPVTATVIDDDPTVVTLTRFGGAGAVSEGDTVGFFVGLSRPLTAGETIDVPLSIGGTGVTTADWSLAFGFAPTGVTLSGQTTPTPQVRFSGAGAQTATLSIDMAEDGIAEGDGSETYTIALGPDGDGANGFDRSTLNTNVGGGADPHSSNNSFDVRVNDPPPPDVTITQTGGNTRPIEGGTTDSYGMVLDTQPTADVTITATSGTPTTATVSGSLVFSSTNWNMAQSITVTGVDNDADAVNQAVTITHAATSTDTDYNLTPDPVTATVIDDDPTTVTLAGAAGDILAGDDKQITVTLGRGLVNGETLPVPLTFGGSATPGTDYTVTGAAATGITYTGLDGASGTVTFTGPASGTTATTATLTLSAVNAGVTVDIDLGTLDADSGTGLSGGAAGTDNLADFDIATPGVTVTETGGDTTVAEASGTDNYGIRLSTQPSGSVTITATSNTTSAATVTPATLTFTTANWNAAQTFTVTGINNSRDDAMNARMATISHAAASTDTNYGSSLDIDDVEVTVTDDDTAGVTISEAAITIAEGNEGTYTVVLATQPGAAVTITATSGTPATATVSPALTFTSANWDTAQTITVAGENNEDDAANQAVTISHAATSTGDPTYHALTPDPVTATVIDDEPTIVILDRVSGTGAIIEGDEIFISVTLSRRLTAGETIDVPLSIGGMGVTTADWSLELTTIERNTGVTLSATTTATPQVTFSGAGAQIAGLTLTSADDDTAEGGGEGSETYIIALGPNDATTNGFDLATLDTNVGGGADPSGSANTFNVQVNDPPPAGVTISEAEITIAEGDEDTYTVVLATQPGAAVTITPTSGTLATATVSPALTFTSANWDTAQTITVAGEDNEADAANQAVTITHAATSTDTDYNLTPAPVTATVIDDDPTVVTLARSIDSTGAVGEGGTVGFTITLSRRLTGSEIIDVPLSISGTNVTTDDWSLALNSSFSNTGVTLSSQATATPRVRFSGSDSRIVRMQLTAVADGMAEGGGEGSETYTIALGPNDASANGFDLATLGTNVGGGADPDSSANTFNVQVNDPPPAGVTISETAITIDEGGEGTYTVVLDTQPAGTVEITVESDTTSAATVGTTSASLTFTMSNWNTVQTVTVMGVEDNAENERTATISHSIASGDGDRADYPDGLAIADVDVTVSNNDLPMVNFAAATSMANEGSGTHSIMVNLSSAQSSDTTINYTVANTSTATADADYTELSGTVVVSASETSANIPVVITNDRVDEANETVVLTLAAGSDYRVGTTASAHTLTITDNDTAGVTVTETGGGTTVAEADGTDNYGIRLSTQPTGSVTITAESDTENAATVTPATLTFTTANWNAAQTFTVTGIDNNRDDAMNRRMATISHAAASTDDTNYVSSLDIDDVEVTVTDEDVPELTVSVQDGHTTFVEGGTRTIVVTSDIPIDGEVLLGGTITPNNGGLLIVQDTFTGGNSMITFEAFPNNNDIDDPPGGRTATAGIRAGSGYTLGNPSTVTLMVIDNDPTTVTLAGTAGDIADGDDKQITVILGRGLVNGEILPVPLTFGGSATPGTDYTVTGAAATGITYSGLDSASAMVTFTGPASGTTATTATLTLSAVNAGVTVDIDLGTLDTDSGTGLDGGADGTDNLADFDIVTPGVTVTETEGGTTVAEASGTDDYGIRLDSPPSGSVTITAESDTESAATVTPETLTFTTANWNAAQTFTVTGIDNNRDDDMNRRMATISHAAASTDTNYDSSLDIDDVEVTVTDEDVPVLTVSEQDGHTTIVEGGTRTIVVTSDIPIDGSRGRVGFSPITPNEGGAQLGLGGTAIAGATPMNTFEVSINNNDIDDLPGRTATTGIMAGTGYTLGDPSTVTFRIIDDDPTTVTLAGTAGNINEGASVEITVTLGRELVSGEVLPVPLTLGGTATRGTDYTLTGTPANNIAYNIPDTGNVGTVTFTGPASATATLTLTVQTDTTSDATETIDIGLGTLDDTSGTDLEGGAAGTDSLTDFTIMEQPAIALPSTLTVDEGDSASYQVVLATEPTMSTTITVTGHTGTDLTLDTASLTFTTSNWDTAQMVTVTAGEDADAATDVVPLTHTATGGNYDTLTAVIRVSITDTDTAGVTITETGGNTRPIEGGTADNYGMTLDTPPIADVTITATSGTGATVNPGSLTFTSANWNMAQTITVTGVDNAADAANQTVTISHAATSTGDSTYNGLDLDDVTATVIDDEPTVVTLARIDSTGAVGEGGTIGFAITLSRALASGEIIDVPLSISGTNVTTDDWSLALDSSFSNTGVTLSGQATATPRVRISGSRTANLYLTAAADGMAEGGGEGSETYIIALGPNDATANGFDLATLGTNVGGGADPSGSANTFNVQVNDPPSAGVTISEAAITITEGDEGTYTVVLATQPSAAVTITPTSGTLATATVSPNNLIFTAANWDTAQIITVAGEDNNADAANQTVTISHAATSTGDSTYNALTPDPVTATVIDDDPTVVSLTYFDDGTIYEGNRVQLRVSLSRSLAVGEIIDVPLSISGTNVTPDDWSLIVEVDPLAIDATLSDEATSTPLLRLSGTRSASSVDLFLTPTIDETAEGNGTGTETYTIALGPDDTTANGFDRTTLGTNVGGGANPHSRDDGFDLEVLDSMRHTVSLSLDSAMGAEGDSGLSDGATLTITIDPPNPQLFQLILNFGGTAIRGGNDYIVTESGFDDTDVSASGLQIPLSIASERATLQYRIRANGDTVDESNETVTLALVRAGINTPSNVIFDGDATTVTYTITDDDTAGVTVSETEGGTTVAEAGGTDDYGIMLSTQPSGSVTITATSNTTSAATVTPTTLTFTTANWNAAQTFTVTGINNSRDDAMSARMAAISHAASSSTDTNYVSGLDIDDVEVTVTDDDPTTVTLAGAEGDILAGDDKQITVTLGRGLVNGEILPVPLTFGGSATPGTDYTVTGAAAAGITYTGLGGAVGTVTFTGPDSGTTATTATLTLSAVNAGGTVDIDLGTLDADSGTGLGGGADGTDNLADFNIVSSGVTVSETEGGTTVAEAGGTDDYGIRLSTQPTDSVTITATSNATSAATVTPTTLTFTTANWNAAQTFTVTGISNNRDDAMSARMATISHAAASTDTNYGSSLDIDDVEVTVTDDDPTTVTLAGAAGDIANGDDKQITVTLGRGLVNGEILPVPLTFGGSATPGTDYTVTGAAATGITYTGLDGAVGTVTFTGPTSGTTATTATLTLSAVNAGVTVDIDLGTLDTDSGTGLGGGAAGTDNLADFDIVSSGVTVSETAITIAEGDEGTYTVVLSTQPAGNVEITVASDTTSAVTVGTSSASLTFTMSNWDTAQTVTVTGVNDNLVSERTADISHRIASGDGDGASYPDGLVIAAVEVTVTDNDTPPGLTFEGAPVTVAEGGTAEYAVELATQPTGPVTVTISGHSGTDLTLNTASLEFTTDNWDTAQTVTVTAAADDTDTADDTVTLTHTASGADYGAVTGNVVVTITDDDLPVASFAAGTSSAAEGAGTHNVVVSLSSVRTAATTITYTVAGTSTATIGDDYTRLSGTVVVPADRLSANIPVTITDDSLQEASETVVLFLGTGSGYTVGTDRVHTLTITDDDLPVASFAAGTSSAGEDAGTHNVVVNLNPAPTAATTITYTVAGTSTATMDTDYTMLSGMVVVPASLSSVNIPVTIDDDDVDEANETVILFLSAGSGYTVGTDDVHTLTITDNDTRGLTFNPETLTVDEGGSEGYTVILTSEPTMEVTVAINDPDGLTRLPASLTFTSTNWATVQTVTVTAEQDDDTINDGVTLTHTASGATEYVGIDGDVAVTVNDDDDADLEFTDAPVTVNEGGNAEYAVELATEPTGEVTVTISVASDTDLMLNPNRLTFTSVNWDTAQTVMVTANPDADAADDTVTLVHTASGATEYGLVTGDVEVTISDDDDAGLMFVNTPVTVDEGASAEYTVELATEPTGDVTVDVSGHSGSDLMPAPTSLTFTAVNWETAQAVTVTAGQDSDTDNDMVTLTHRASGATEYAGIDGDVAVTITDDDVASVVVSPTDVTVGEAGGTATYTVVLDTPPVGDVEIMVASDMEDVATVSVTGVTFTTTNWNRAQTVTVTGVNDGIDNAIDRTASISHRITTGAGGDYPTNLAIDPVRVTAEDDDIAGVSVSEEAVTVAEAGGRATYTVVLDTEPTAEVTLTAISQGTFTATVNPPSEITFTQSNWGTAQTLTVMGVNDDIDNPGGVRAVSINHGIRGGYPNSVEVASVRVAVMDDEPDAGLEFSRDGLSIDRLSIDEGGAGLGYEVALTTEPTGDVTVTLTGAPAAVTLSANSLMFTAGNWSMVQTVTVTAEEDTNSTDESAMLVHTASGGGYDGVTGGIEIEVTDDDRDAGVSIGQAELTVTEGEMEDYRVMLDAPPDSDVEITVSSSAAAASVNPTILTFTASNWSTEQTVTVTGADDDIDNAADRTANLSHAITTGDGGGYTTALEIEDVTVTVADDDEAGLMFTSERLSVIEGGAGQGYRMALTSEPTGEVTVTITGNPVDVRDVTLSTASLMFTAGNWSMVQTVTVTAGEDANTADESATLTHTASGGGYDEVTGEIAVEVTDDDRDAGVSIGQAELTVTEGEMEDYRVVLDAQPDSNVEITVSSSGAAASVNPPILTFTASNWSMEQTVTVTGADDDIDNAADRTANLSHAITTVAGGGYTTALEIEDVTVTVADDDEAGLMFTLERLSVIEGETGRGYRMALTSEPTGEVTVTITGNPGDVTLSTASLMFTAGNWDTAQTVTVTAGEDSDMTDEDVALTHTASGGGYDGVSGTLTVEVSDDDRGAGVTVSESSLTIGETGTGTYTIRLNSQPEVAVLITVTPETPRVVEVNKAGGMAGSSQFLTFTPMDWGIAQEVTVTGVDDDIDNPGRRRVSIRHAIAPDGGDGAGYPNDGTLEIGAVLVTVTDDEGRALSAGTPEMQLAQEVWLPRFGLTAIEHMLGGLDYRFSVADRPPPGLSGNLNGLPAGRGLNGVGTGGVRGLAGVDGFGNGNTGGGDGLGAGSVDRLFNLSQTLSLRDMLRGSRFVHRDKAGISVWGQASYSRYEDARAGVSMDGEVTTGILGVDRDNGRTLLGLALSYSDGDGDWSGEQEKGELSSTLTSLLPYIRYDVTERLQVWGALSYGRGELEQTSASVNSKHDLEQVSASMGLRGTLLERPVEEGGLKLALTSEATLARIESDDDGGVRGAETGTRRFRLGLEWSWQLPQSDGGRLIPELELGMRYDGGDTSDGLGVELGGGISWELPSTGLTLDVRGRRLLDHENAERHEWGVSGSLRYDLRPGSAYGPSLSLSQEYGNASASGGLDRLLSGSLSDALEEDSSQPGSPSRRWSLEGEWGLSLDSGATGVPYAGLSSSGANRDLTLGWRLLSVPGGELNTELDVKAIRREDGQGEANHGVGAELKLSW